MPLAPAIPDPRFDAMNASFTSNAENAHELVSALAQCLAPLDAMPKLEGQGIYIFHLRDGSEIPGIAAGKDGLLYVGMTERSLHLRNHFLHRHSGGSTFRRSLGAILREELSLEPISRDSNPENTDKYRFTEEGEQRLSCWMEDNLLAAQLEVSGDVRSHEATLIAALEPPLNLTKWKNPQKAEILAARFECRNIVAATFEDFYSGELVSGLIDPAMRGDRESIEELWKALARLDDADCHDEERWLRNVARRIVDKLLSGPEIDGSRRGALALAALGLTGRSDRHAELKREIIASDSLDDWTDPERELSRTEFARSLMHVPSLRDSPDERAAAKTIDRVRAEMERASLKNRRT